MLSITFSSDTASSTTMTLPKSSSSPAEVRTYSPGAPARSTGPLGATQGDASTANPLPTEVFCRLGRHVQGKRGDVMDSRLSGFLGLFLGPRPPQRQQVDLPPAP